MKHRKVINAESASIRNRASVNKKTEGVKASSRCLYSMRKVYSALQYNLPMLYMHTQVTSHSLQYYDITNK